MNIIEEFKDLLSLNLNDKQYNDGIQDCIEIVKKHDRQAEICKWQSAGHCDSNIEFEVQCNHNPLKKGIVPNNFAYQDFKFCPFCGRKIKWVRDFK